MSNTTYILNENLVASKGSRFLNYILDMVSILLIIFILSIIIAFFAVFAGLDKLLFWMSNMPQLAGQVVFIVFSLLYYTISEAVFGRTVGKLITGTLVVDDNGNRPSWGIIFKRTLCRFIPFEALSCFGDRGWHDSITDTYVVNKKALNEEVRSFHEFNLIGIKENE